MTEIESLHDVVTNGAGSCATCHNSTRTTPQDIPSAISAGMGGMSQSCVDCHSAHNSAMDHNNRPIDFGTGCLTCSNCHTNISKR